MIFVKFVTTWQFNIIYFDVKKFVICGWIRDVLCELFVRTKEIYIYSFNR